MIMLMLHFFAMTALKNYVGAIVAMIIFAGVLL